ncbi:hypothetical protein [Parasphingorhabdus halotolerans]|uniref:Uncharacterized protein n=1 Tax=Parasphingorhabdus halotolerans TaxID=2725558 RepID=A0A6H2DJL3_9SPHN|nr:hypothetical protein [Parasphingorhabdus halotolerans]QJB68135.1 hypothetical protein HF685_01435 [Parasphingorhabdus halotolerans]
MKHNTSSAIFGALAVLALSLTATAAAQDNVLENIPGAKGKMPTIADHPDMGQLFGMQWMAWSDGDEAALDFGAPETDNRLWSMRCDRPANGEVRIVHQIEASLKDMGAGDRFGFTIRVDEGQSLGFIARMELTDGEGGKYYTPRFYTSNRHSVFEALAKGERAFMNLSDNKFSVHLKGSGEAIKKFLRACT